MFEVTVVNAEVMKAPALVAVACSEDDYFHAYVTANGTAALLPRFFT
jgi:hypothetical protein